MGHLPAWICGFDIDRYLVPVIPASPLSRLRYPIAHFLGYRVGPQHHVCEPLVWFWTFIGTFCGIALIEGVYRASAPLQSLHPPIIIGSFGAAAILEYNTVASPLAQPRNLIFSHAFCSVIAVGITKLFALLPHDRFEDLRWLAGAIIVATCSVVMSITKTVHPPAGAMALLAATSPQISNLGWNLVPLVMIGAALMLGNALAINNIQRQFPLFWMTPVDPHEARRKLRGSAAHLEDSENKVSSASSSQESPSSQVSIKNSAQEKRTSGEHHTEGSHTSNGAICISRNAVKMPHEFEVSDFEKEVLESLRLRLGEEGRSRHCRTSFGTSITDL
ncbi:MAG: hypothetical protein Q9162_006723 [Coniocarpon cinnabarinum]